MIPLDDIDITFVLLQGSPKLFMIIILYIKKMIIKFYKLNFFSFSVKIFLKIN